MQPLDLSFMKAFKHYYALEITLWMDQHHGGVVTDLQIGKLFTPAYEKAATMTIAKNGFKAAGVIPYNPNIFEDYKFPI